MFNLIETISRNNKTKPDDTAAIKFALTSLGYYDDTETGLSPYADDNLFQSIQTFQKDKKLKVDGVIKPDGETQKEIKSSLKKDKKSGNAFMNFKNNFDKMNKANTIGADKYFHCMANYEAASRGWDGVIVAKILSDSKEMKDKYWDNYKDGKEDQAANKFGRKAGKSGKYHSAKAACHLFRPEGLDEKYKNKIITLLFLGFCILLLSFLALEFYTWITHNYAANYNEIQKCVEVSPLSAEEKKHCAKIQNTPQD